MTTVNNNIIYFQTARREDIEWSQPKEINVWEDGYANHSDLVTIYYMYPINMYYSVSIEILK